MAGSRERTSSVQAALDEGTRQRRELLDLLIELQWCGEHRVDYDDTVPCCPICGGIQPKAYEQRVGGVGRGVVAHTKDCRLAKKIGGETTEEYLDDV